MFINYAHRGASEYAPENTLAAFYMGIEQGANGIETDIRPTKDGIPVLFHDDTLERVCGETTSVSQLTYEELLGKDVGSYKGSKYCNERVVSLADFMRYFSGKELTFALEIKGAGVEKQVLDTVKRYDLGQNAIITSFMLDSLKLLRCYDSHIPLGYLCRSFDRETVKQMVELGIGEICPEAKQVEQDMVNFSHQRGLNVRAWGVKDLALMHRCLDAGVDGMTVNFPDKLTVALAQRCE